MPFIEMGDVEKQVVERMVIQGSIYAVINLRYLLDFQVETANLLHI